MTDRLPTRGFTELPAPDKGLGDAIALGRRLRRRRQAAHTGLAGLVLIATAGTGTWLTTSSHDTADQLVPADPRPQVTASADAAALRRSGLAPAAAPSGLGGPVLASAPAGARPGQPAARATPSPAPQSSPSSYRTPALKRTYTAPDPTGATICGATVTNDANGTRKRIDWCMNASVLRTKAGHDLAVTICRDQTGASTLSFRTSREVELEVRSGSRVVWRWSIGQPETDRPHVLNTPAGACWAWTAPWTDVDSSGRPLATGSYELVSTSRAKEIAELPDESATFRVD